MFERTKFIVAYQQNAYSMTELAERFGVSRKTAYKWLARFNAGGLDALYDQSRAPHTCPHRTEVTIAELIIAKRKAHPAWGARKLLKILAGEHPGVVFPSYGAAHEILRAAGLVTSPRSPRPKPVYPHARPLVADVPNATWSADFKGEFLLGNQSYCYPLTVMDAYSRYVLGCDAFASPGTSPTRASFARLFAEHGLPVRIRTDNGTPFAHPKAIHRLSKLGVYFIKLGIRIEHIDLGQPQQNGAHERMHRTLKAATTRPPEKTLPAQQQRFDAFRDEYNEVRPHQALDFDTPAARYVDSPRPFTGTFCEPAYPAHAERRLVSSNGTIRFKNREYFLTSSLSAEDVALEEIDHDLWNVYFYDLLLGRLNLQTHTFIP